SMILAASGAEVIALERHPQVYALLSQGLELAKLDPELSHICQRISLIHQDALSYLQQLETAYPDIIYFDPMYPEKKKSALSRKEMQVLQNIIGKDEDADGVFLEAQKKAKHRVVVKRPRIAPFVADAKPDFSQSYQSARFD